MKEPGRATSLDPGSSTTPPGSRPIGQLLVAMGFIESHQLAKALEIQRAQPARERQPVGRICVDLGYLTKERLDLLLGQWSKRLRLGELLANRGLVTPAQLGEVLERQRRSGERLGRILIEMGLLDEIALTETLAEQYDLAYVPLREIRLAPDLVRYVNATYAWRRGVVPIGRIGKRLTVAIHDPTDKNLIRDLELSTGFQIQAVLSTPSEVTALTRRLYEFQGDAEISPLPGNEAGVGESPRSMGLMRKIVTRATSRCADGILFERKGNCGEIRLLVGGAMERLDDLLAPPDLHPVLVRTLKAAARLDPSETGRAQEGFLTIETDEGDFSRPVLVLVSTCPEPSGELVRARFPKEDDPALRFKEMGLTETIEAAYSALLARGKGVVLIVGPPGSAKRSTLRGRLDRHVHRDSLILTAEEPILRSYPGVEQTPVDPPNGASYARLLETFLERKPDLILLERIPDLETARIVFSTDGQGPLILSTLRAANATSAVSRLLSLGVAPDRIERSLAGVLAQRTLRKICPDCEEGYEPRRPILAEWFRNGAPFTRWRRGAGCERCHGTGFSGRIVASELWVPTAAELGGIRDGLDEAALRERVLRRILCLGQDGLLHAVEGRTTLEEALRFVSHDDVVHTRLHGLQPNGVKAGTV